MWQLTNVQHDCRVSEQRMKELKLDFDLLLDKIYEGVLDDGNGLGAQGGDEGQLMWYVHPDKYAP